MTDKTPYIRNRVFELLRERGMTQRELSKLTGIPASTISDWKNKGNTPNSEHVRRICEALNIELDEIYEIRKADKKVRIISEESELWNFIEFYDNQPKNSRKKILAYAMALMNIDKESGDKS